MEKYTCSVNDDNGLSVGMGKPLKGRATLESIFLILDKKSCLKLVGNYRTRTDFLSPSYFIRPIKVDIRGAPVTYFNDRGGGWVIFLGLKFWPKGDFLGLWKTPRFFWVVKKKQRDLFGLRKKDKGIFLGMPKKVVVFLGRQILKL